MINILLFANLVMVSHAVSDIIDISPRQHVGADTDVELRCVIAVVDDDDIELVWLRETEDDLENVARYGGSDDDGVVEDGYQSSLNQDETGVVTWSLILHNIRPEQSGHYYCQVSLQMSLSS